MRTLNEMGSLLAARGLLCYRDRHFILPNPDGLAEFYKM